MKNYFLLGCLLLLQVATYGQDVFIGILDSNTNQPLIGAIVKDINSEIGGVTDQTGHVLLKDVSLPLTVEISYVGYKTTTKTVESVGMTMFGLSIDAEIESVIVETETPATDIDPLNAQQVENLSSKELLKAACCNLSESFENNASVDINFNDAITGSKQIRLLGLAGVYTQINYENMPLIRGLGEYYGLGFVPGTWVESIQVGKGAGSVVNGFESMTGQINVEFHKPDNIDQLYVNGYQNARGRTELNLHGGKKLNEQWSTALFLHGNLLTGEQDVNDDGFIDRNKGGQVNIFNRWKYVGDGNLRSQLGARYLHDQKVGGQLGFSSGEASAPTNLYGVDVVSDRVELFAKNGLIFPEQPWKSIGLITNASHHTQNAIYGLRSLESNQQSIYANLIYQTIIGDTRTTLKTGGNLQYDNIEENLNDAPFERNYTVPGVFAEIDYDNLKQIKIVAGLRADYLNTSSSVQVSPRLHFKWTTDGENALRLSAGRGFRVPNLYADNPATLINSRIINIENIPDIESSWNMGASITRYFKWNGREGTFSADFYRTSFTNQLIRDFFSSPNEVIISNLDGQSFANSYQVNFDYELFNRFDVRLAAKHDDVKQTFNGELLEQPLTPRYRGLLNLSYATQFERWRFDVTSNYIGEQRLIATAEQPDAFENAVFSDNYFNYSGQITKKLPFMEIYLGGENLSSFRQENPIISPENPFGNDFDGSNVWAPIQGINIYAGFRYSIKQKEK